MTLFLIGTFGFLCLNDPMRLQASDTEDQGKIRALLVTEGCGHGGDNQAAIIRAGIAERTDLKIEWKTIYQDGETRVTAIPFYQDPNWADGYDVVIHNECFAGVTDKKFIDRILKPHRAGLPALVIHCARPTFRVEDDRWFEFCGMTSRRDGSSHPFRVEPLKTEPAIMEGLEPWEVTQGELYFAEKIWPNSTPLAHSKSNDTGKMNVSVWVNLYGEKKIRVFGTTIGHDVKTMINPHYLDMLSRGFLWAVGKLKSGDFKKVSPEISLQGLDLTSLSPGELLRLGRHPALKGKTTASSEESSNQNFSSQAVDGNPSTRWCAQQEGPAWWEVDMGKPKHLRAVVIQWESGTAYRYTIEGSSNGFEWGTLVDASRNKRPGQVVWHSIDAKGIRFLRVNCLGSQSGAWGSIREFAAYPDENDVPARVVALAGAGPQADVLRRESNGKSVTIHTPLFPAGKGELEKTIRLPEGYRAHIFARPPAVNYPVFVKATAEGRLFVSVDKNGSVGREPGRGKVLEIEDSDGDGVGDEFYDFIPDVDSPRGLEWDGEYLYVMHSPELTRYRDTDGDHVADQSEKLVDGIGFDLRDRPTDHTSNGLTLGIDGWLYLAIGDFGVIKARGADGTELSFRGGGVLRVRPDGSGLQVFARGTRNIYDVAVSPLLDVFARDNTNNGGGWDVRLHHFTGLEHHGYPSLFRNFGEEMVKPLAEYGGGSGTGGLWLGEPEFPEGQSGVLLTADWGRQMIYRHELQPAGASFREIAQHDWIAIPRPTSMDVDGWGRLYVASWKGGGFSYNGENVGYVALLTPPNGKKQTVPEFGQLRNSELVDLLKSDSQVIRKRAQQEILRRKTKPLPELITLMGDEGASLEARTAALFALAQIPGADLFEAIRSQANATPKRFRALVFRALGDRDEARNNHVFDALATETDPGVAKEMMIAVVRTGTQDTSILLSVLAKVASADPVVAHTAVRAITELDASHICFVALDDKRKEKLWKGAMKALSGMHREEVIHGILNRMKETRWAGIRNESLWALARLYYAGGDWKANNWGGKHVTEGPCYHPVTWKGTAVIAPVLKKALTDRRVNKGRLLYELGRNHIRLNDLDDLLSLAEKDTAVEAVVVAMILERKETPRKALPWLARIAEDGDRDGELRLKAAMAMVQSRDDRSVKTAFSIASVDGKISAIPRVQGALITALINDSSMGKRFKWLLEKCRGNSSAEGILAWRILLHLKSQKTASPEVKEQINMSMKSVVDQGGNSLARLLNAIAVSGSTEETGIVKSSIGNEDEEVRKAALEASMALGIPSDPSGDRGPKIGKMKLDRIIAELAKVKGDAKRGKILFAQQSCSVCHTVSPEEAEKGPYLGNVTATYKQKDLVEAIVNPNRMITKGFGTEVFYLKNGIRLTGYVGGESADEIDIRDIAGNVTRVKAWEVKERVTSPVSMMPSGLVASLTIHDFASLLAYLESSAR